MSATEYDRILIFKEPFSNKALEGHLIRTEKVSDEGNCRLKCYLEPNCVSVNVGPLDKGTHICELNNDTDESPSYLALVERQLYTYHAVEVWLDETELISFAMTRECLFKLTLACFVCPIRAKCEKSVPHHRNACIFLDSLGSDPKITLEILYT